jgi:hypothetical protein
VRPCILFLCLLLALGPHENQVLLNDSRAQLEGTGGHPASLLLPRAALPPAPALIVPDSVYLPGGQDGDGAFRALPSHLVEVWWWGMGQRKRARGWVVCMCSACAPILYEPCRQECSLHSPTHLGIWQAGRRGGARGTRPGRPGCPARPPALRGGGMRSQRRCEGRQEGRARIRGWMQDGVRTWVFRAFPLDCTSHLRPKASWHPALERAHHCSGPSLPRTCS